MISHDQPIYAIGKQFQWMFSCEFWDTVCIFALYGDWQLTREQWIDGGKWIRNIFNGRADFSKWKNGLEKNLPEENLAYRYGWSFKSCCYFFATYTNQNLKESLYLLKSFLVWSFKSMLPWIAALDRINYLRWGSMLLHNMRPLQESLK